MFYFGWAFVRFIHTIVYSCRPFLPHCCRVFHCVNMHIYWSIYWPVHSTTDRQLDDFQFSTIRNSASRNTSIFSLDEHRSTLWLRIPWLVELPGHRACACSAFEILPVFLKDCTNLDFCQQSLSTSVPYILSTRSICCPFHLGHVGGFALFQCWGFSADPLYLILKELLMGFCFVLIMAFVIFTVFRSWP